MAVNSNLGPFRIRPMGAYSSKEKYRYLDLITFDGSSYININYDTIDGVSCIGIPPVGDSKSEAYWQLVAQKGEDGIIEVEYLPITNLINNSVWDFSISDKIYIPDSFDKRLQILNVREGDCGALITKNRNLLLPVDSDYSTDFNYVNITTANEYYLYTFLYANVGFGPRFVWHRTVIKKS